MKSLLFFVLAPLPPLLFLFRYRIQRFFVRFWHLLSLLLQIIKRLPLALLNPHLLLDQMVRNGLNTIPLLAATSLSTGMVAAVQAKYQFRNFVPDKFIGTAAMKMILIELGPVLTGLVLAGKVGSALAAEIACMKEKEELDAMRILNLDPLRYLAAPRMLSTLIMVPALTILSIFISTIGAYWVSIYSLDLTSHTFLTGIRYFYDPRDVLGALVKSFAFGMVVSLMGYYRGIHADAGSKGVGNATMKVVVTSCILILMCDSLITFILFQ